MILQPSALSNIFHGSSSTLAHPLFPILSSPNSFLGRNVSKGAGEKGIGDKGKRGLRARKCHIRRTHITEDTRSGRLGRWPKLPPVLRQDGMLSHSLCSTRCVLTGTPPLNLHPMSSIGGDLPPRFQTFRSFDAVAGVGVERVTWHQNSWREGSLSLFLFLSL